MHDDGIMRARPWPWLERHIRGLLSVPPRVVTPDGDVLPATRLGWELNPPKGSGG